MTTTEYTTMVMTIFIFGVEPTKLTGLAPHALKYSGGGHGTVTASQPHRGVTVNLLTTAGFTARIAVAPACICACV